jgi:hypothetical protein
MGMRSPNGAAAQRPAGKSKPSAGEPSPTAARSAEPQRGAPQSAAAPRPATLTLAAVVTGLEAVGLCVAGVFSATDTAAGRSYRASSGIAFTVLEFIVVAGVAWAAFGLARVRPWSRTPAVLIQVITGVVAIYLLQAHRFYWGVPALLLAVAGLAGLLAPASLHALTRSADPGGRPPADPPA